MKLSTITLASFLSSAALLQAQLGAPKIGLARYADHTVHAIYGLPFNFVLGKLAFAAADAISFSDSAGLVSRAGNIQLIAHDGSVIGEYNSAETAPVLNVDRDLKTAIAWLPSRHALLHWNGTCFELSPVTDADLTGTVTSLRLENSQTASLLITGNNGDVFEASVSLETGNLISLNLLPGVRGSAFRQDSFLIFEDQQGLEIESPNGSIRSLPLAAADLTFERMSSDWLHLSSASARRDWALHLNATSLSLSQLPVPGVQEAAK